jgi:phosphate transport system substrate-binding protein
VNRTSLRRLALPGVAIALGLAVSACGAGNEAQSGSAGSGSDLSGKLNGAGSSAQEAAMDAWRAGFQKDNPGVTINYDPAGSGAGVEKFNAGGIDFAGSDSALAVGTEIAAARQRCGADAIEVPDYVSPIAIVYNLDGVTDLRLSPRTLAGIFSGKITSWDAPAIAADNPGTTLPATTIKPVHRSDDSGTTANFTDYLSKAGGGAWTPAPDKVWPFRHGEAANQTSGMVAAVRGAAGSIGYADDSQAGDLGKASIKVGSAYVAPSAEGAAKALEASPVATGRPANDLAIEVDRGTTAAGAYPLMLTSYLIACPTYDKDEAELVKGFLTYVLSSDGQQAAADNAGSAPLPASLQEKAQAIVDRIAAK